MSEIDQLRADIEKLAAAHRIINGLSGDVVGEIIRSQEILERKIARLEAEEADKADPWAIEKQVIETLLKWSKATHGNAAARYARHLECQVDNINAVAEVFRRDFESARKRIAELQAELAKRPVVWCVRNREKEYEKGVYGIRLFSTEKDAERYSLHTLHEPYTGEQS